LYILGPINLALGTPIGSDLHKKFIVDGQQRIVTLCLLLAAIRQRFQDSGDTAYVEQARSIQGMLRSVRQAGLCRVGEGGWAAGIGSCSRRGSSGTCCARWGTGAKHGSFFSLSPPRNTSAMPTLLPPWRPSATPTHVCRSLLQY